MAKSAKTGTIYVVAKYSPPGNVIGQYQTNVIPKGYGKPGYYSGYNVGFTYFFSFLNLSIF